jgi:hypothetical protein
VRRDENLSRIVLLGKREFKELKEIKEIREL